MMKTYKTRAMAGAAALAIVGGLLVAGGGAASAATIPPWEPDPTSIGGLTFYNASGAQVTGGNITDAPFAAYVQAGAAGRAGDTKATLFGYLPKNGVAIGAWSGEALTASTNYPNATAPGALGTSTLPLVTLGATDETIAVLAGDLPNTATDSYQGLYQLRLKTSGAGQPAGSSYDSADILITGTTWTQVYPTVTVATTTAIAASPASPAAHGSTVSLTATVVGGGSSHPAGAVEFFDGTTDIGSGAFVAATGIATKSVAPADGAHSFTAVFTAADPTSYSGSTSVALPYTVNAAVPAASTSTALSVNPTSAPAFSAVALHANITKTSDSSIVGAGSGAVKFFDGAALLGQANVTATGADLSVSTFAVGPHSITAQFVPADATVYNGSTSTAVPFTATTPTTAPASQTVSVSLAPGTLTITTPYSSATPFNLGSLLLDPVSHVFKASAPFGSATNPAQGVTVIDGRAGDQPWTASVTSTDFVDGAATPDVINGQNLSFTSVSPGYITGDALNPTTKAVVANDVTSSAVYGPTATGTDGLKGGPHQFATALHGLGSVNIFGSLNLTAPASTPAGTYTATLTFTIA
jgi:Bacterial Ig-like domain (group 3)